MIDNVSKRMAVHWLIIYRTEWLTCTSNTSLTTALTQQLRSNLNGKTKEIVSKNT